MLLLKTVDVSNITVYCVLLLYSVEGSGLAIPGVDSPVGNLKALTYLGDMSIWNEFNITVLMV